MTGTSDPEKRLAKKVREQAAPEHLADRGPCLFYTGADNGNGYGQFCWNGKGGYAHRYAWERDHGPIPAGLTVDHLCRVRRCVNTAHMELVPPVENFLRAVASWTTCKKGHEYTPENIVWKGGRRYCRICKVATSRRGWERRARLANGLPDRRHRLDQIARDRAVMRVVVDGESTNLVAREVGMSPAYLQRLAWKETRRLVLEREQGACAACGSALGDIWHAHHRSPRRAGGTSRASIAYAVTNVIALHPSCHDRIESEREWALDRGFLVKQGQNPASVPIRLWNAHPVLLTHDGGYGRLTTPEDAA